MFATKPKVCAWAWGSLRVNPGLPVWISGWNSVSCTGFSDVNIITRKTRKSHRNTENIKNRLDETHVVPSPVPLANFQFAQLRPVLWTGPPTRNPLKRKSKICSAKTALRAARKSTEFTKGGTGVENLKSVIRGKIIS